MEFQKLEVVHTFWITLPGFIRLVHQTNSDTTQTLKVTYTVEDNGRTNKIKKSTNQNGKEQLSTVVIALLRGDNNWGDEYDKGETDTIVGSYDLTVTTCFCRVVDDDDDDDDYNGGGGGGDDDDDDNDDDGGDDDDDDDDDDDNDGGDDDDDDDDNDDGGGGDDDSHLHIKVWNKINSYLIFLHVDQLFNHFGDSRF